MSVVILQGAVRCKTTCHIIALNIFVNDLQSQTVLIVRMDNRLQKKVHSKSNGHHETRPTIASGEAEPDPQSRMPPLPKPKYEPSGQ